MPSSLLIGNDIVDLSSTYAQRKPEDARFLSRVFTEAERSLIATSLHPALALWSLWAAKETGFKVAQKLGGQTIFAHRKLSVHVQKGQASFTSAATQSVEGRVTFEAMEMPVRWELSERYIHCMGVFDTANREPDVHEGRVFSLISDTTRCAEGCDQEHPSCYRCQERRLTPLEMDSVHSPASQKVRLLAKHLLAERQGLDVEVVRRPLGRTYGPPQVLSRHLPVDGLDVSLSHDGPFLAVAVASAH